MWAFRNLFLFAAMPCLLALSACSPSNSAGTTPATPAVPSEAVTNAPVSPVAPITKVSCKQLPDLAAGAQEISVDDIKTNAYPRYQLVAAQAHAETEFIPEKVTTRAMVSIKISVKASIEDPDILSKIDCKSMDGAPDGELSGDVSGPLSISTADGTTAGNVLLRYRLYGKSVQLDDELKTYESKVAKYSTLLGLKNALKEVGEVHLYRIGESQVELRSSQIKSNGKIRYLLSTRHIFEAVR